MIIDEASIFNCTSLGFIYVWLCSPQASNNNNNNNNGFIEHIVAVKICLCISQLFIYSAAKGSLQVLQGISSGIPGG